MNIQKWQSYIPIIKDIVTALAALTGGIVALIGLKAWRRQLKGKTEYELARRILRKLYKVQEALNIVLTTFNENSTNYSPSEKGESTELSEVEDKHKELAMLLKNLNETTSNLQVEVIEAKVLWGEGVAYKLKSLIDSITTFSNNPDLKYKSYREVGRLIEPVNGEEIIMTQETANNLAWLTVDIFTAEIEDLKDDLEAFLKPQLK